MTEYKDNIISEFYKNLDDNLLNLSHKHFERKYAKSDNLNLKIHNYYFDLLKNKSFDLLDKHKLFSYLYPGESFNESKLTTSLNRHLPDLKEFAIITEVNADNEYIEFIWSDFLLDNQMKRNIKTNINKNLKKNIVKKVPPIRKYFNSRENYFFNIHYNETSKPVQNENSLNEYIHDFESYADYTRMQLYIGLIVQYFNLKDLDKIDRLKPELNLLSSKHLFSDNIFLSLNAQILKLYLDFSEEVFNLFYNTVFNNINFIPEDDKLYYFNNLLNFIVVQSKKANKSFRLKEYELYLKLEDLGLLNLRNSITFRKLINIIYTCLRAMDIEKASYFLEKYSPKIPKSIRKSCYSFNKARILFAQKNYNSTLLELNQVDFSTTFIYAIESKKLELKSLICLGHIDVALARLSSFNKFINENKEVKEKEKEDLLHFRSICRLLCKPCDKKNKQLIQEQLNLNILSDQMDIDWVLKLIE